MKNRFLSAQAQATAFRSFMHCADTCPDGVHQEAKDLRQIIGDATDGIMQALRAAGLDADNCDAALALEAAIYAYVKDSNPDSDLFASAEGAGDALAGPARDRVLCGMVRDRDFLASRAVRGNAPLSS